MFRRVGRGQKALNEKAKKLRKLAKSLGPQFVVVDEKWLVSRVPIDLPVDLTGATPEDTQYGDIVTLGTKENPARDRTTGALIPPMQRFKLVRVVAATKAGASELPLS